MSKPSIIRGGIFTDHRGSMRFVNDFKFEEVKRFYFIKHSDVSFIRAWQGHMQEQKWFYPIAGAFIIAWVKIDDFENPSMGLKLGYQIISSNKSELLHVPNGYANGIKALEADSEILVFSSLTLEESKKDDYRYPADWWLDWDKI